MISEQLSKNWINMFDAIFYINMKKSIKRKKHIEKEFSHFNGDLIRIEAVTPEILGARKIEEIVSRNTFSKEPYRVTGTKASNANEIALGCSHSVAITSAIEYFKKTGKSKILIIEDDACIVSLSTKIYNQLGYVSWTDYDIWQLGYTIFTDNLGSWLMEREYAIDCQSTQYGTAKVNSGIFGTLGYAINLHDDNIEKFETFAYELSQGSISDYCLSEQKYLKKIIFEEKLLMPLNDESTISTEAGYSAVEYGYTLNAFKEGFVRGTYNYDHTNITCKRHNFHGRLAYLIVEHQDRTRHNSVYHKEYVKESFDAICKDSIDLFNNEYSKNSNIWKVHRAYAIIFDNLSKPNLGKRHMIYDSTILK